MVAFSAPCPNNRTANNNKPQITYRSPYYFANNKNLQKLCMGLNLVKVNPAKGFLVSLLIFTTHY